MRWFLGFLYLVVIAAVLYPAESHQAPLNKRKFWEKLANKTKALASKATAQFLNGTLQNLTDQAAHAINTHAEKHLSGAPGSVLDHVKDTTHKVAEKAKDHAKNAAVKLSS